MAESRETDGYERRRPDLPRTYSVYAKGRERCIDLRTPVVDALDAEPGDEVEVSRNDRGEVVLSVKGGDDE